MDDLAHLFEVLLHFLFCAFKSLLAEVDCFGQQPAPFLDVLGVSSFLEFNSFGFQKAAEVAEKFVFINLVHIQFYPSRPRY